VGWAVYGNQDKDVPCHRIVNKEGYLAKKFSLGGWREQKARLEPDGVVFSEEDRVDLEKCLWHPDKKNMNKVGAIKLLSP
jgi:methylated-DNA-protein-cysteine methyltransferase-like protein